MIEDVIQFDSALKAEIGIPDFDKIFEDGEFIKVDLQDIWGDNRIYILARNKNGTYDRYQVQRANWTDKPTISIRREYSDYHRTHYVALDGGRSDFISVSEEFLKLFKLGKIAQGKQEESMK